MEREMALAVDRSQLKDIHDVVISQIGSPYCYLDNGVVVEIGYADTQVSLQDRLVSYISGMDQDAGNLR